MPSVGTVISYPAPAYANFPINADFYQPSRFVISNISLGVSTTVTTSVAHNYVIGQEVRLLIPFLYGSQQLNQLKGYVLSVPSTTQVVVDIDSSLANSFVANPLTSIITNATKANPCVLTSTNPFRVGNSVVISGVGGMTQLNGNTYQLTSCTTSSMTLNINSSMFSAYTSGGLATLVTTDKRIPQIIAIGDINSGSLNSTPNSTGTYIPGSFIDISPN